MARTACLLAVFVLLGACTGTLVEGEHLVPDDYAAAPGDAAYLVGSIGFSAIGDSEMPDGSAVVLYRRKGDEQGGSIRIGKGWPISSGKDYEDQGRGGQVFSIPLRPGEYEIHSVSFRFYVAGGTKTVWPKEDFSVPFVLQEGKAYYIGEFLAYGLYGKNIFRITIPVGGYFRHSDNFARDEGLIRAKYPELADMPIESLDLEFNVTPLIVAEGE